MFLELKLYLIQAQKTNAKYQVDEAIGDAVRKYAIEFPTHGESAPPSPPLTTWCNNL